MSLREWLILVGIIVIAVVLIDGYRRVRLARKRATELSFGLEEVKGDSDDFGSELPNGGARKQKGSYRDFKEPTSQDRQQPKRVEPGLSGMGFEGSSDLKAEMPIDPLTTSREYESFEADDRSVDDGLFAEDNGLETVSEETIPVLTNPDEPTELPRQRRIKAEKGFRPRQVEVSQEASDTEQITKREKPTFKNLGKKSRKQETKKDGTEKLSDRPPAKEVVVINVISKGNQPFDGERLLQSLLGSGMRFGDMSIFHRYANDNGTGKILFSMANGVEPGIFNLDNLESTSTPAVSFFMGLPGPDQPLKAFTKMVEAARQLALDLGGELKDEQLSVMTQQTIEHSRQCIIDYERKQLTQKIPS